MTKETKSGYFTTNMWNFLHETDARLFNKHSIAIFYQKEQETDTKYLFFDEFFPNNLNHAAIPTF